MRWQMVIFLGVFLAGCGPSAFISFTGSSSFVDALPHTQRVELIDRLESKALLSATHLNATYPEDEAYWDHESFFVGLYIHNDFKDRKAGLNNPLFELTLNGEGRLKTQELKRDDPLLKLMPLVNRWSRYYIVRFPPQERARLQLKLSDLDTDQSVELTFAKVLP